MAKIKEVIYKLKLEKAEIGTIPYIEIGDVDTKTKEIIEKEKPSVTGSVIAPANSILISKVRPTRGAITLLVNTKIVSGAFTVLKTKEEICLPEYLFYQLAWNNNFHSYLGSRSTGATYPTVKEKDILEYEISELPSLQEQKRIIEVIKEAVKIKTKRIESNQKITDAIPAIFSKMFGDPETNPMKWNMVPLCELGTLDRGKSQHRPRTAPGLFGGPYPFVQTGDISNASWRIKEYKQTYSEEGLRQSKIWPKETLCITVAANIAKTSILDFESCFPDSVVGFIPNKKSNVDYVQALFLFLQKRLEEMAPRAAQLNINLEILRNLQVPNPPIEMQKEFAERVKEILIIKNQQEKSTIYIDDIFSSILSTL